MNKIRQKNSHKPYYVGAEVLVGKDNLTDKTASVELTNFGHKERAATKWLESFPPMNTPDGGELKRVVLRLPLGYREKRNILSQYKKKGMTHAQARFRMLSDHAGPKNILFCVVAPKEGSGDSPNTEAPQHEAQPGSEVTPTELIIPGPVRDESAVDPEGTTG